MSIKNPEDVQQGLRYKVVEGLYEGREGICVGQDTNSFGYVWKTIRSDSGEEFRTRWSDLARAPEQPEIKEDSGK